MGRCATTSAASTIASDEGPAGIHGLKKFDRHVDTEDRMAWKSSAPAPPALSMAASVRAIASSRCSRDGISARNSRARSRCAGEQRGALPLHRPASGRPRHECWVPADQPDRRGAPVPGPECATCWRPRPRSVRAQPASGQIRFSLSQRQFVVGGVDAQDPVPAGSRPAPDRVALDDLALNLGHSDPASAARTLPRPRNGRIVVASRPTRTGRPGALASTWAGIGVADQPGCGAIPKTMGERRGRTNAWAQSGPTHARQIPSRNTN